MPVALPEYSKIFRASHSLLVELSETEKWPSSVYGEALRILFATESYSLALEKARDLLGTDRAIHNTF